MNRLFTILGLIALTIFVILVESPTLKLGGIASMSILGAIAIKGKFFDNSQELSPTTHSYMVRFMGTTALYGISCFGMALINKEDGFTIIEKMVVIIPISLIFFASYFYLKGVQAMDELQRRLIVDSMAVAGLVTGLLTISYTFLEPIGFPPFQPSYVFICLMCVWGIVLSYQQWNMNREE